MTTLAKCEQCGATLSGLDLPGLCPACLMAVARASIQHDEDDSFSSTQYPDAPHLLLPAKPVLLENADLIPNYRIIERLGEGGMGIVYKAEQRRPVHRIVAIKLVKLGMDTREVIARFEAERQALALMNHPNVAKVFEAGASPDGRPYFVMEYVCGQQITEYCNHHRLTIRARLELFQQACEAVHHAHQKAIIHRDIKAGNVLVTTVGEKQVVKVIDFGVAKALSHRLTEHTLVTEDGRLVGTPEYMSPEQADMNWMDIDTRSDIYSLGVLLYELLAGVLPFASETLRTAAFDELRRIIREQDPPRPSDRLTKLGDDASKVASQRSTELPSLYRELRSDLEWIPLKAMRKERSERYRSCSELADDINHYLNGRPLIAGPQTTRYRVKKMLRKHHRGFSIAAGVLVVILGLTAGLAVATRKALIARKAEAAQKVLYQRAALQAQTAEHVAEERLARKLIQLGDTVLASGQQAEAQQNYLQAMDIAEASALPDGAILARLYDPLREQGPLMGYFGKNGGVGGFVAGTSHVTSIALSKDGRLAVTGNEDRTLKLWDLRTGNLLRVMRGHERGITYVAFSPDDRTLLSGSYDKTVRLWNAATGQETGRFTGHPEQVWVAIFSPDGKRVLSGDLQGNIKLWDVADQSEKLTLHASDASIASLAFSHDGKMALSGGKDAIVRLWNLEERRQVGEYDGHIAQINSLAFLPGDHIAVTGSFDSTVQIWDTAISDAPRRILGKHTTQVFRIAASPDGKSVLSGSTDETVRLWRVSDLKQIRSFPGQLGQASGVAFSNDGRIVAASGDASLLRTWTTDDFTLFAALASHGGPATCIAISNDGIAIAGTGQGGIVVADTPTRRVVHVFHAQSAPITSVGISTDSRMAMAGTQDGALVLMDLQKGTEVRLPNAHSGAVTSLLIAPDGSTAVTGGADHTIRFWKLSDAIAPVGTNLEDATPITSLAVSQDGGSLLSGTQAGIVRQWDIARRKQVGSYAGHAVAVRSLSYSSDGSNAIVGLADGTIEIHNIASGQVLQTIPAAHGSVIGISRLPDGTAWWSSYADGTLSLWDSAAGNKVREVVPEHGLSCVAFSPDGRCAVLAGQREARVADFGLAGRQHEFERRLPMARAAIARNSSDPAALATFGQWYALRGEDRWALELLKAASEKGADVSPLMLARCQWRVGNLAEAQSQFRRAQTLHEAPPAYLQLCLAAVSQNAQKGDSVSFAK